MSCSGGKGSVVDFGVMTGSLGTLGSSDELCARSEAQKSEKPATDSRIMASEWDFRI
jgi:hypothetical protein